VSSIVWVKGCGSPPRWHKQQPPKHHTLNQAHDYIHTSSLSTAHNSWVYMILQHTTSFLQEWHLSFNKKKPFTFIKPNPTQIRELRTFESFFFPEVDAM
jgi:hypothetical protein